MMSPVVHQIKHVDPEEPWHRSDFINRIIELARQGGDLISDCTFREIDAAAHLELSPEVVKVMAPKTPSDNIKIITELVKTGNENQKLTFENLAPYFSPISHFTEIVLKAVDFQKTEEEVLMLNELKELGYLVDKFGAQISTQFLDLKDLEMDCCFYTDYSLTMKKLFKSVSDILANPTHTSISEFESEYKGAEPTSLVKQFLKTVEHPETNPFKLAMTAKDEARKSEFFEKWELNLESAMVEALLLELFASGIFFQNDTEKSDEIVKEIAKFREMVNHWRSPKEQ